MPPRKLRAIFRKRETPRSRGPQRWKAATAARNLDSCDTGKGCIAEPSFQEHRASGTSCFRNIVLQENQAGGPLTLVAHIAGAAAEDAPGRGVA
jgi:hypothetical protein